MKSKSQKKEELAKLKGKISKSKITVLTSFAREGEKGLNVSAMRELKKGLKTLDAEYLVEKKTLLDKALKEDKKVIDVFGFAGSLGAVFSRGDEVATAKSVYTFSKKNPAFKYFGAFFGDKFLNQAEFAELAKLPPREVLIGRVFGMMNYPISGLVNVLQGNIRSLVVALNQIANKKQYCEVPNNLRISE